ncbi:MAG: aminopeptidase P family protein [Clostridia bacterium]|nr:aminopeptidase P family protein [Clostridia bacterium]
MLLGKYEKIQNAIPSDADGILLTSEISQYYATGFELQDGYVLITKDKTYLLCDFRYTEAAKEHCEDKISVDESSRLGEVLVCENIKTLMFEEDLLTVAELERLTGKYSFVKFIKSQGLLKKLRVFKEDDEIECIVSARRIAERSFSALLPTIKEGMTETELAVELEFLMRRNGADGNAFETIFISGASTSKPHGVPQHVPIEKGFVTVDFGALYKGYRSDMTRTFAFGCASEEMRDVYNTVLKAQMSALEYLELGGRDCFEADKQARDIIDEKYKGTFGHSLGHGVGLQIHESPRLSPACKGEKLSKGHVVTVEPGIYIPGCMGVRIEDMVVVYEDGIRNITECPKELIEIC